MAEKGAGMESQGEECPKLEEIQQVIDSSQGGIVTPRGKVRPVTVISRESGYSDFEVASDTEQVGKQFLQLMHRIHDYNAN